MPTPIREKIVNNAALYLRPGEKIQAAQQQWQTQAARQQWQPQPNVQALPGQVVQCAEPDEGNRTRLRRVEPRPPQNPDV